MILKRFFVFLLGFATTAFGAMVTDLSDIQSIQADFKQITVQQNQKIIYTGQLFTKFPYHAKWVYKSPLEKEVFVNNDRIIIYEPRLLQATYTQSQKNLNIISILRQAKEKNKEKNSFAELTKEASTFDEPAPLPKKNSFDSEEIYAQDESYEYVSTQTQDLSVYDKEDKPLPKPQKAAKKSLIDVIKTYFVEINGINYSLILKNGIPSEINFVDEFDNTVKIELSNVILNGEINNSIFIFNLKPGLDVIRQ